MKPEKAICEGHDGKYNHCDQERYIACKSRGQCQWCSEIWKREQKKLKGKTGKPKVNKASGQLAVFLKIWNERPHLCQVTGDPIPYFDLWGFMHLLSKKAYPRFMLYENNILLVKRSIHTQYDDGDRSDSIFKRVNELHDELITEYYANPDFQPTG